MKKLFGLILTALLLFSGCAQQAAAQGSQPVNDQQNTPGASGSQLAQNQTRVYGKIQEINGNEVVLEVGTMKMPTGSSGNMRPGESGNMRPGGSGKDNTASGGMTPPDGQTPPDGMTLPDGQTPPDGQQPGSGDQGDAAGTASGSSGRGNRGDNMQGGGRAGGFGGNVELEYTGETKTILIPVGLKITTGMGANAKESDFTTLAKENVIMVVLEKGSDSTETVVSIKLIS